MITLLAIKNGKSYFRFKGDRYYSCDFAKASVFPADQAKKVEKYCATIQNDGLVKASIVQLTITETPYTKE